jgi:carboxymethylenebutenolidase
MCDEHSLADMAEFQKSRDELTRRRFGALALGTGVAFSFARAANALDVAEENVEIKTPDGTADCYFAHPTKGKYAAVLVWPDAGGLRPTFRAMGKRLAESGYSVLVVNPFYRTQKARTTNEQPNIQEAAARGATMTNMTRLTPATHVIDARAFVPWLDAQASVDKRRKIGTTGYCMGGPITMRTAATFPDRVGAGASFHGGGVATYAADSPHLLVAQMKANFLFAIAANDDERDPEQKKLLRLAFDNAKLPAEIEVYTGTKHGWCPPGGAVYDEAQAEKAWTRMLALFKTALA